MGGQAQAGLFLSGGRTQAGAGHSGNALCKHRDTLVNVTNTEKPTDREGAPKIDSSEAVCLVAEGS